MPKPFAWMARRADPIRARGRQLGVGDSGRRGPFSRLQAMTNSRPGAAGWALGGLGARALGDGHAHPLRLGEDGV